MGRRETYTYRGSRAYRGDGKVMIGKMRDRIPEGKANEGTGVGWICKGRDGQGKCWAG